MTTRSDCVTPSSFKGSRALSLGLKAATCISLLFGGVFASAGLQAQSPTAAPDSSAARNLLAPAPPTTSTGPSVSTNAVTAPSGYVLSANDQVAVEVLAKRICGVTAG
ncbi:MAG TPA: hypothetical protein VLO30_06755 [Chthoniobacterales bacterium]|nr:hypothetical protein [Chthoniobacterales bacterium]